MDPRLSDFIRTNPDLAFEVWLKGSQNSHTMAPDTKDEIARINGQVSLANKDLIEIKSTMKSVRNWLAGAVFIILGYVFYTGSWKGSIDEKLAGLDLRLSRVESKLDAPSVR